MRLFITETELITRIDFIKIEWLRVAVMIALTISLPFLYLADNQYFPLVAFGAALFWMPFALFMVSTGARCDYIGGNY